MTLVNSTVSGNTTAAGTGGVQTYFGNLTLTNSIVLGNSAGGSESNISAGGTLTRNGGNIIGTDVFSGGTDVGDTTAAAVFAQTVDIGNGVTAGVLADNGGRVQTIALKRDVTNPALDTGNDGAAPGADARGVAYRDVLGVANNAANISDLGAFEAEPEARGLTVHTANDIVDQFDNLTSLREAITYANSLGGSQGIDFTGGLTNQTLWLASALPTITANLTIDGRSGLTISGDVLQDDVRAAGSSVITDVAASYSSTPVSNRLADNVQIFNLSSALTLNTLILTGGYSATTGGAVLGTDVTLNGTTVRGNLSVGNGGGLYATGSFSATNSTISDNFAGRPGASTVASGGGFYSDGGTISLLNTTVSKSTARLDGGGFYASGNATITIDGSTISGNTATAGKGGGFRVNGASADVTVNDSTVSGNFALDGGGGFSIAGSASLARSTVSGNSSTGNHSGGATVLGTLTAADSTFSGNDGLFAGAIYAGAANLTNVTISGNTATGVVGGVYVTGNVTLTNSIVLGNAGPAGESSVLSTGGTITRNGGNIIGKASGGADVFVDGTDNGDTTAAAVFAQTATVGGVSAGVLANNGGAVQTIALRRSVTNPALDTSNSSASGSDARGIGPFDLNSLGNEGGGTNTRDLGAYEIDSQETQSLTVTTLSDVADPFDDQTSLREAITYANNLGGSQTVTFANGLSGGLIRLAYLLPTITTTVTFDGDLDDSGSADITITGDVGDDDTTVSGEITDIAASSGRLGDNIRLFNATVGLTVDGLVLTGGNDSSTASGAGGGAIRATNVTLTNATVQGNYAARNGGGVYASGNLNVTGSTISGNSAEMGAGLFASGDFAQVTIGRSTISKNIARAGDGGGLGVTGSSSNVTVTDTTISGNTASAGQGGGLATGNGLSLTRVTVSGNSAVQGGGASVMSITATNTTIAGNTATIAGGISAAAQTTLVNSTVTGNSATTLTGGILAGNGFTLTNSIVLGNSANGSVNEFQSFGAQVRSGGNIIGKTGGADVLSGNIDIGDTTAAEVFAQTATVGGVQAGVLGDNGGLVQTVALKASGANPALDASNGSAPTADARGEARVDHTGVGNNGSNFADLGAYEVQVLPVAAATSGGTTASFEQIAVVIDAGVTVTNSLGPTLTSATVSISPASFESGQDVLGFVNDNTTMGDIVASYSAGTGVLTLTSASGTATVTQWQAALRAVTYTNTSNTPETSDRIISFSAADGSFSSARPTKTVSVTAVNDAPVGTDKTVIADADTDYVLGAADFPYTDFESDGLLEVEITTVPALGTLTLDGVAVSAGDFVSAADLAAGKLIYHPPADAFGHGYASFTFRVRDGGGTANNGQNFDQSANTVTIDVRETKSLIVTTDADVGDDYDGVTSLRDAIAYANVHAGGDTITFTNALSGHTVRLAGLLPTITESLAIDGDLDNNGTPDIAITGDVNNDDRHANGSTVITDIAASITANRLADNVRIFSSTAPLTVEGLILTGGVDMTIAAGEGGGAIRGSSVSLSYTTVAGNFAAVNGGGVYASGDVIATDSKISGNFANISIGGVISTGGGFYSGGGTVFIVRSTISGNSAALGGGFYSSHANANITVDQTTISGNEVFDGGGGGFRAGGASSVANISDAMIGGNTANGSGGGFSSAGRVTLTRATVSGNSSTGVEGGGGHAATLTATNTTVSGNTASSGRAGGFSTSGDMTLTNSTVSGNTAASIVGGLRASGDLTLTNLIVLGNSVGGSESNAVAGDTLIRNGNNIIGTDVFSGSTDIGDTTAAAVFAQTVTVGGVSAGVLANNGGALQTIALRESATNPALDRANASAPATDARGEARADQPGVGSDGSNFADLGAYELANSVPVVTTSGGATAADEQTATVIDASITVVDTDSATLASATVSITGAFQTAEDVLAFVNDGSTMGNIDGSYDAGTGVLTLTSSGASATLTQWQAALRAVTYINTADAPETTDRTISFVVNDGGFTSVTKTKTVAVIPVNDTPVNTIPAGPLTALEDVGLAITGLTVADVDADPIGALITVTLSVQHGTLHVRDNVGGGLTAGEITGNDSATVTLTCHSDRISATLGALNGLVYTSDLNYNGADTLTMTTNDGGANGVDPGGDPNFEETTSTVAINVVPVNDVPSFTKGADQTVAEDAGSQTVNNWATNLSTGPANESTQGLSFVVTNDNNAMFSVQPSVDAGGKLIYTPAADANGTATVTVAIMDDGGTSNGGVDTSTTQTFTITITPVNDAPVITLSGQIANFLVDTLAPVPVVPGIVIADIDSTTLDGVTVSITAGFTAGDQLNFVNQAGITGIYDAATGVLTLTGNASLAAYRTALASITFETNDRDGGQRTLTWIADDGGAVDNTSLPRTSIVEVTAETLHTPSKSPNVTNTGPTGGSGLGPGDTGGTNLITSVGGGTTGGDTGTTGGSYFYVSTEIQTIITGSQLQIQIPIAELAAPLGGDIASVTATLLDGSALPAWLEFDPVTGTLKGNIPNSVISGVQSNSGQLPDDVTTGNLGQSNPPAGSEGSISIQVKLVDSQGNVSTTIFTIKVAPQKGGWLLPRGLSPELSPWRENARDHAAIELNRDLTRLLSGATFAGLAAIHDGDIGDADVASAATDAPRGRAGLSEQLGEHGWRSMHADRRTLLASLQRGVANWR
ncbi:MAG: choice-of-anchor Q domain-containing protein [Xanthobacteraceae bacterium]